MRRRLLPIAIVVASLLLPLSAWAAPPEDALGRATPRGAASGFLDAAQAGDYAQAAEYLDLQRIPKPERAERGLRLARQLSVVLAQTRLIDLEALSESPEGLPDDDLPAGVDALGTVTTPRGQVGIRLQRVDADDGTAVWKISAASVAQIPALYQEFGYGILGDYLPAFFFEIRALDVALWQWLGLLVLIGLAWLLSSAVAAVIVRLLRPIVLSSRTVLDEKLLVIMTGPLRLGVGLILFSLGLFALALPLSVRFALTEAVKLLGILAVAWGLVRIFDVLGDVATSALVARGRGGAAPMVPVARKAGKALVAGLALIAVLQNLGVNVTGILAGLGIGGLAVALAAQRSIEHLFGGITLMLDQPVRVGDFCRFGDKIGTIEAVGLRSTRVRTLDRTVITIPNGEFASLQLENFARRDKIWLHPKIGLRYETTPDQLRFVLVEVRKMLYAHPKVEPDPARIRFVGFGDYSLDLEIFAYVRATDYGDFLAIKEDIQLRIMDIVAASGTGFAFPSQTTYFARDAGLDPAKGQAAEAQVRVWRTKGELPLPDFPPEAIAALGGTLNYPPDGAAVRKAT